MSRQNTFTVVPRAGTFATDSPPARPMTSKQVRKAYKASTKTPTMTRADRYKWERAEQERIRKELDKERTAAKARAARERKKEKETAVLDEKKRSGMPLVVVRPSQDTIARFVRGNGSGKKRGSDGETPVSKKLAVDMPDIPEENEAEDNADGVTCGALDALLEDDELEDDILEELNNLADGPTVPTARTPCDCPGADDEAMGEDEADTEPCILQKSQGESQNEAPNEASDEAREEAQAEANAEAEKEATNEAQADVQGEARDTSAAYIPIQQADQFVKPPLPLSAMTSYSSSPPPPRHAMPPMSTQAIFTNIEEFFPTSSQQLRELEDDGETDFGSFPSPNGAHEEESNAAADGIISQGEYLDLGSSILVDDFAEQLEPDANMELQSEIQTKAPEHPKQPEPEINIQPEPEPEPPTIATLPPPQPPPRFFTSSGSREQLSLALQRSRRTAALEEIREKERQRREAGAAMQRSKQDKSHAWKLAAPQPAASTKPVSQAKPISAADKENASPTIDPDLYNDLFGSQETEYGGDWIEEIALDLAI